MRAARAAASLLIVALVGAIPLPAYAVDQVIETELMVSGTPEADGKPVKLDTTILTTDPRHASAGNRAGTWIWRHQGR